MKVIAFITDCEVVDRIINYMKLPFIADRSPPQSILEQVAFRAADVSAKYF